MAVSGRDSKSSGVDLVEELAELLDLVLLLVRDGEPGLVEDVLGCTRMPAPVRSASAIAVRRARAHLDSAAKTSSAKKTPSSQLGDADLCQRRCRAALEHGRLNRSWVSGRGGTTPCCANAIAVASTAPIQIGR